MLREDVAAFVVLHKKENQGTSSGGQTVLKIDRNKLFLGTLDRVNHEL